MDTYLAIQFGYPDVGKQGLTTRLLILRHGYSVGGRYRPNFLVGELPFRL